MTSTFSSISAGNVRATLNAIMHKAVKNIREATTAPVFLWEAGMIEGLNPCPECWGEESLRLDWNSGKSYVCCEDCGVHTLFYDEEECAIADWNSGQVISRREVKQSITEHEAETKKKCPHEGIRLRSCRYCGSEGTIIYYENANGYYATCKNEECYAHTEICGSAIGAADEWNEGAVSDTWYRRAE